MLCIALQSRMYVLYYHAGMEGPKSFVLEPVGLALSPELRESKTLQLAIPAPTRLRYLSSSMCICDRQKPHQVAWFSLNLNRSLHGFVGFSTSKHSFVLKEQAGAADTWSVAFHNRFQWLRMVGRYTVTLMHSVQ